MSKGNAAIRTDPDGSHDGIPEDTRLSRYSLWVVVICCLGGIVEGFDYAAAAFAVPLISQAWATSNAVLGIVLMASALGAILGNIFVAPLGDRWGRRPAVILNLLLTASATFAGGLTTNVELLALTRLICGIGVGGLYPNLISLGLEYLPPRHKSLGAMIIACSMPIGLSISGFISGALGAQYGWPSIFYVSAILSFIIVLACAIALPESPAYLLRFPLHADRARQIMARAFPGVDPALATSAMMPNGADERIWVKFAALLSPRHRTTSLLIWAIFFLTMCMNYFFSAWLPTALTKEGMDISQATRALSIFTIGGLVGSLFTSRAEAWVSGPVALGSCYLVALVSLLALGQVVLADGAALMAAMFFVGWGIFGGQFALIVMTGRYYSTEVRSTGIAAATAIGRLGGVGISLLGGLLLTANVAIPTIFTALAAPALIALAAVIALGRLARRRTEASADANLAPAE